MAEAETQRELLDKAVAGDRAAIQQLLLLHHGHIAGIIGTKVPADLHGVLTAEDVCQETYVVAFRQIASFRPHNEEAFRRWLMTIAERKLVDAIRSQRAAKRGGGRRVEVIASDPQSSSVIELLDAVAVHERTPSRSVAHREMVSQVQNALADLKEEYRDALRLHYVECLTVAEVAARMDRTEGSVRMLCSRGLRRLAEIIGDPTRFFSQSA